MSYFSHSKKQDEDTVEGSKLLKDHIAGVSKNAQDQFYENLLFSISSKELGELLLKIVQFHDLGKYTSYFQNYLLQTGTIDSKLKQHAKFGGYAAYHQLNDNNGKISLIALLLIFRHHNNLIAPDDLAGFIESDAERVFNEQHKDVEKAIPDIEKELDLLNLSKILRFPEARQIRKACKIWVKKNQTIEDYFLINYLFSLLIEADKLDASETSLYSLATTANDWVDKRFSKPTKDLTVVPLIFKCIFKHFCMFGL